MYPNIHLERPYFVNLASFHERIYNHVKQQAEKYFGELRPCFLSDYFSDKYITTIVNLN